MNLQKISETLIFYTSSKEMLKSLEQTKMFLSSLFVIRIFNNCKDPHDLNYLLPFYPAWAMKTTKYTKH